MWSWDDKTTDSYIYVFLLLCMHVSLKFLEYTCASGPESTVPRTQKLKLYRPRRFDPSSLMKGSARSCFCYIYSRIYILRTCTLALRVPSHTYPFGYDMTRTWHRETGRQLLTKRLAADSQSQEGLTARQVANTRGSHGLRNFVIYVERTVAARHQSP
jgi:hypothetical protein